ncbi:protein phosphatase 4 regulatory subunit 2-related protein [Anticarsia gemmatalis]|uniref:protein phosphatase 4 regulatory subunit 2-related protein n=1 Tax=Anticarsia gemmatalis TaxID=129554 RepID=UPI003F767C32
MENAEEIFHFLEEFSKRKPKTIPQELNEYLAYVARTGDPVYQWSLVRPLFKEKLVSVITDFYETSPGIDIPPYPNVDPFNYDSMKNALLERLDSFASAPFTVQRICELLTYPRKQYNRVDKFMRAVEKNILVVSTREPGIQRHPEPENGEPIEPIVNGSDNNSEYNVDVEMEDMSWKDNAEQQQASEPQPGSSDAHISVDDIEARLKAKKEAPMDTQDKIATQYESVTPPELNISTDEQPTETKTSAETSPKASVSNEEESKEEATTSKSTNEEVKPDVEMKPETSTPALIIPEIKVDDAEMTEQRLSEQTAAEKVEEPSESSDKEPAVNEAKTVIETQPVAMDESSSDSTTKEDIEPKLISEVSSVSTSSEESSSSSDNTDGNSNSPKTDERHIDVQDESNQSDTPSETPSEESIVKESEQTPDPVSEELAKEPLNPKVTIESDNYSISDVNSELPQPPADGPKTPEVTKEEESKEPEKIEEKSENVESEQNKTES